MDTAQSGLSWLTILRKRDAYRATFHNFDIDRVAQMTDKDVQRILDTTAEDPRDMVVRHRGKIQATIHNAKCLQQMYQERKKDKQQHQETAHGIFDAFLWSFVNDQPILNTVWKNGQSLSVACTTCPESHAMSTALKQLGFKFAGPSTCYALMQSVRMVLDHPVGSPEWKQAKKRLEKRPGGYQMQQGG